METKQELEVEIKTLKGLRRQHYKEAIIGGIVLLTCASTTMDYWSNQQGQEALLGGLLTLVGSAFFPDRVYHFLDVNKDIRQAYKKIRNLENLA